MISKLYTLVGLAGLAASAFATVPRYELVSVWETPPVLYSAESVRYSSEDQILYVSNMGPSKSPSAKDGDGSIGKVGLDGQVIDAQWVQGLNGPKGLGVFGGKLFVADIDRVVVIDVTTGKVMQSVAIGGARSLNDLTIDDAGAIYVSDHAEGKIFQLKNGDIETYVAEVKNPNGVLAQGGEFYVLARGEVLRRQSDGSLESVVTGLDQSVDGIELIAGDDFLVTAAKGVIYHVNVSDGTVAVLRDSREQGPQSADLGYDARHGILYVPTLFTHQVEAFKLKRSTSDLVVGQSYEVPELDLRMAWIPPGKFIMGSPDSEGGRESTETPHPVTFTSGFWMGVTEVTVDEWAAFATATGYVTEAERGDGLTKIIRGQWLRDPGSSWRNPGFSQTGSHPVVGISWNDASAFCQWLTRRERAEGRLSPNWQYTLPTEAEWEYAARADAPDTFIVDSRNLRYHAWYRFGDGVGNIVTESNTHPTGVKRANAWGLYDVHGNVFEWCRDWYGDYASAEAKDPTGPKTGELRVCRSGSWYCSASHVRLAFRGRDMPSTRSSSLGFRLSLSQVRFERR